MKRLHVGRKALPAGWGEALAVDPRGPAGHTLYFHTNEAVGVKRGLIAVESERLRGDSHSTALGVRDQVLGLAKGQGQGFQLTSRVSPKERQ